MQTFRCTRIKFCGCAIFSINFISLKQTDVDCIEVICCHCFSVNIGLPHPDSVVETSSLASITPPDVHYRLSLPKDTIVLGKLSALQLESVVYACQKHESFLPGGERAGFLIGQLLTVACRCCYYRSFVLNR